MAKKTSASVAPNKETKVKLDKSTATNANKVEPAAQTSKKQVSSSKTKASSAKSSAVQKTSTSTKVTNKDLPHIKLNLDKTHLLKALKNMMKARYTDDKHLVLVTQGRSHFHIGVSGHEATQTAIANNLEVGKDWGWTYYRDMAFVYAMGYTPREYFLLAMGKEEDPATGGRQMPGHYGHPKLNLPTQSSPTGTQFLNAVGCSMASKKNNTDEVTYVSSGDGTTSQGEFYEAVNWATKDKLPTLFHIQDNGFAISVPREDQSMGENVTVTFENYKNLFVKDYDGNDYLESVAAAREAIDYIRAGKGPALLRARVTRLKSHSSSDDHRKYRPAEDIKKDLENNDCIKILSGYLVTNNLATQNEIDAIYNEAKQEVDEGAEWAESRPDPNPANVLNPVLAPAETRDLDYATAEPTEGNLAVMVDAVNHALAEEMRRNSKMLIFGEDVADPKGGVFTATRGLTNEFGDERVFNSPLAEASIAGLAMGLAVRNYKPVIEMQFGDYIWPAFMQYRNEIATMRFRSNGGFKSPVVTRVAVGGYIQGGLCHSQNIEGFFSHIPGILIAYPSTAADAKGLLKTACRIDDPVMFLEHKALYRSPYARTVEPDENYLVPFGKGKIVRDGDDAVIVTYGMGVKDSVNAVKRIEKEIGKTARVIDLRTITPWDKELVLESVKKLGRVLIVHEDTITSGFGAEISATISQQAFNWLDAPVMRLAGEDSHIPYAVAYETAVLPNEQKVYDALTQLLKF